MSAVREIGARLRGAGLTPRALAAWAGTDRISALPARLAALASVPPLPAARVLAVFVAGAEIAAAELDDLVPTDLLVEEGLATRAGDRIRARVAVVPLGPSLLVCDRADAGDAIDLVAWPDDSSHHLASAIPAGRRRRWIDLGCGSAFAALARPELAGEILGIDLNPRALEHARLGVELSQIAHISLARHDVAGVAGPQAELVTCNAPIPDVADAAVWRRADPGFFDRLWPAVADCLAPEGLAVVHAARAAIPADLPGERVIVSYAPGFAVLWWRPDAPPRVVTLARELTPDRPHVDAWDREDAVLARPC